VTKVGDALERGRDAYARGAWREAFESLTQADRAASLAHEDLELLARSAYMLGLDDEYRADLERAHRAYMSAGAVPRAARCAVWIGHNLLFRGDRARATGWFARAQRLLDGEEQDCVERGYLLIPIWLEQMSRGDYAAGQATAAEAAAIAERFGDADLFWLAVDDQGRALVRQGRVQEGLRLVDEVLVAASAGELSPFITGIVYCNTIAFCQSVLELRHAREWTEALTEWCERQPEMVAHNGLCLVHRAEIMQIQGAWADAFDEARRAAERFTQGVLNELACGKALYRQAEILRLRGELGAADEAYRAASRCGYEPQPGLGLLRLAQGKSDAAAAMIRRALGESAEPLRRAVLLPAVVQIMLVADEPAEARKASVELAQIAERRDNDVLNAMAAEARGNVALAADNAWAALVDLRRAASGWQELHAVYETARVRMQIGRACRALGDEETAALELEAAETTFAELGADPDLAHARSLRAGARPSDAHALTTRELEVLRLIATGKSNKDIAGELVLSERTIDRHVSNIFTKLRVGSRTAATAYAYEHGLL
jgi:DNA-binding NarL/FixJ family response regulator